MCWSLQTGKNDLQREECQGERERHGQKHTQPQGEAVERIQEVGDVVSHGGRQNGRPRICLSTTSSLLLFITLAR